MLKKFFQALLPLALVALFLAVLQVTLTQASVEVKNQANVHPALIIGTTQPLTSLDPAEISNTSEEEIFYNAGHGLLAYNPGTRALEPGLATGMPDISPDGLVYTFSLKSTLQFSDGTPFDAATVKWSVDRAVKLGGGMSYLVTEYVSETNVIDSLTIEFVLKQAATFFPQLVAKPAYAPVSPNCFPADQFDPDNTCGGIGPYKIANWEPGVSAELVVNPGYYGATPPVKDIIIRHFDTSLELRQALEAGEIDVAWKSLEPLDYQQLKDNPDLTVAESDGGFIRYLCINTEKPPFDLPGLRVALAAALDRAGIAQEVYSDTRTALYSMVPSGIWSHHDSFKDLYGERNLELAQTLLTQEGYSETNKLEVELWYPLEHYGALEPQLTASLAANIEETGMVSVTLISATWTEYVGNMGTGVMPVFLLGWTPDYPDPDNFTWPFAYSSSSSGMGIYYNNPVMDALLEEGRVTTPMWSPLRETVYEDIQELWAEEAPTIPIVQELSIAVTQDEVHGITVLPSGALSYDSFYWFKILLPFLAKD